MSTLKVEIVKINEVKMHPNADALDLAVVNGWQSVIRKGSFKTGDLAVYFPLDSVLEERLSDTIGVTSYLSKGRVRAAKLRGESSFGLLWSAKDAEDYLGFGVCEGMDITDALKVTKWVPPLNFNIEDAEVSHPNFFRYTEIENMRNYPDLIKVGDDVIMTEKIHGTNARHAYIDGQYMAGGHNIRFKENAKNRFWNVFDDGMKVALKNLSERHDGADVVMYGEVYGSKVQDLHYGMEKGNIAYRCFDISVNGKYLGYTDWFLTCTNFSVPMVPVLFRGKFNMEQVLKFSTNSSDLPDADNIMEGVVIRLVVERHDPAFGRVILKYVFDQYLNRKGGSEFR